MIVAALFAVVASATATPDSARDEPVRAAIHAGVDLCHAWIDAMVHKKIRGKGFDADGFAAEATKGMKLDRVDTVPDAMLPQAAERFATEFWHIDAGAKGGVFVIASRLQFACHVVGGGNVDLQPLVQAETNTPAVRTRWQAVDRKQDPANDMASTSYRRADNKREELLISSAIAPGGRMDRAQFMSTLMYRTR